MNGWIQPDGTWRDCPTFYHYVDAHRPRRLAGHIRVSSPEFRRPCFGVVLHQPTRRAVETLIRRVFPTISGGRMDVYAANEANTRTYQVCYAGPGRLGRSAALIRAEVKPSAKEKHR